MAEILTLNGERIVIDDADLDLVQRHQWHIRRCARSLRYPVSRIDGRHIYLHRFLMRPASGYVVDHVNGDCLDNRRANLRVCTHTENTRNRSVSQGTASGFKGVTKTKASWRFRIELNGRQLSVSGFASAEEAASAYDMAAVLLHGEFACLNFAHVFPEVCQAARSSTNDPRGLACLFGNRVSARTNKHNNCS